MKGTLNQKKGDQVAGRKRLDAGCCGKHQVKMTKPDRRPIALPRHKGRDYQPGLASSILKQAGLQ
jgi:hypothetical protein